MSEKGRIGESKFGGNIDSCRNSMGGSLGRLRDRKVNDVWVIESKLQVNLK